jgi:hypothetical protein
VYRSRQRSHAKILRGPFAVDIVKGFTPPMLPQMSHGVFIIR